MPETANGQSYQQRPEHGCPGADALNNYNPQTDPGGNSLEQYIFGSAIVNQATRSSIVERFDLIANQRRTSLMHGKNEPEETNIFCNFDRLRPATSAEAAQFDAALRPNLWFDQVQNAFFVIHGDLADCKNRPVTDLVTFSGKEAVTLWFPTGTRTTVMSICSWYVTKNIKQGAKVTISDSGDLVTYARGSRNVGNKFKNLLKERQAVDTTMLFDGTILHELTQSFGTKGSNERPTNDGGSYGWSNIRKASGNIAVGSTNADSLAFYALGVYLRNNSVKWAKADR